MFDWLWEFLFNISHWILELIDGVYKIFLVLAGAAPAGVQAEVAGGSSKNILEVFFEDSTIQYVFWAFMIISFFIFFVSIIIGIIKSEVVGQDNIQPKIKIFKRAALSFFTVIAMPVIFVLAIWATTFLMGAIVEVMGGSSFSENNLSQKIFEICLPSPKPDFEINGPIIWSDSIGDISHHYDLSQYNYFIAYIGGGTILFILAIAALNLVERLINIIMLYIISPFVLATSPLDDGNRFGIWRDLVISKLLGIGGMVISLYLYFILLNVAGDFFTGTSYISKLTYLLFAIGGALAATKGGMMIANIVGQNTAMMEGQQQAQSARLVGTGLMTGMRLAGNILSGSVGLLSRGGKAITGMAGGALGAAVDTGVGVVASVGTAAINATGNVINQAMQSSTTFAAQTSGFQQQQDQQSVASGLQPGTGQSSTNPTQQINQTLTSGQQNFASPPIVAPSSPIITERASVVNDKLPPQGEGSLGAALNQDNGKANNGSGGKK